MAERGSGAAPDDGMDPQVLAVVATGLLNAMGAISGVVAMVLDGWDRLDDQLRKELLTKALERTLLVTGTLQDLTRGASPEMMELLGDLDARSRQRDPLRALLEHPTGSGGPEEPSGTP